MTRVLFILEETWRKNEVEWTGKAEIKKKGELLATGEASKAIILPCPESNMGIFNSGAVGMFGSKRSKQSYNFTLSRVIWESFTAEQMARLAAVEAIGSLVS